MYLRPKMILSTSALIIVTDELLSIEARLRVSDLP
jgi:hypothetical protein